MVDSPPHPSAGAGTDPREDELWVALDRAARVLSEHPEWLREKEPDYPDGLNVARINKLARGCHLRTEVVYRKWESDSGGHRPDRRMDVMHPSGRSHVSFTLWSSCGFERAAEAAVRRAIGYLEAWRDDRAVDLQRTAADWFTLDVLSGRLRTTRLDEPSEQDWTERGAARLRSTAKRLGLVQTSAETRDVASAVLDWLVLEHGAEPTRARATPVRVAVELLDEAAADLHRAGAPRLELASDGRHLLLNATGLTYVRRVGGMPMKLTLRHGAVRIIVRAAQGLSVLGTNSAIQDARSALSSARGGPFLLEVKPGQPASITPRIAVDSSLVKHVEAIRTARR